MSDTGLFSSQYEQARNWAEMVDGILVDLKAGSYSLTQEKRQNLGRLLIDLARRNYNNERTRFMVLQLQTRMDWSHKELAKIGDTILSGQCDEEVISFLERFAQILEQEQIGAMSRMRQWTR